MPEKRTTVARVCQSCGIGFQARTDSPGLYCSNACKFDAKRLPPVEKRKRVKARQRARYLKNREQRLESARAYRERPGMREANIDRCRQYYAANKSALLEKHKVYDTLPENRARRLAYLAANRDRYAAAMAKRRSEIHGLTDHFIWSEWTELKTKAGRICLRCERSEDVARLTVDHIVPLTCGGTNLIDNIQPLCGPCNRSKGAKAIDYRFRLMQ